jgi:hypothetical protein
MSADKPDATLLTSEDLAALMVGTQQLTWNDDVGVALGALVRACTAQRETLHPHVLGALCATAERMREQQEPMRLPTPRVTMSLTPLPAHELFALPVGGQFIVRWAKDDNVENNFRLPFTRQVIKAIDDDGTIYTDDGYEWQKREIVQEGFNELDTGRGSAYFFRYDPNDMKVVK